jgi:hypothetical protein
MSITAKDLFPDEQPSALKTFSFMAEATEGQNFNRQGHGLGFQL